MYMTSCEGTYVVNATTSIMSCTNKLIEDSMLAQCNEFDSSLVNRPCKSAHLMDRNGSTEQRFGFMFRYA